MIQLDYCPTDEMITDVLTISLLRPQFEKLCSKLGATKLTNTKWFYSYWLDMTNELTMSCSSSGSVKNIWLPLILDVLLFKVFTKFVYTKELDLIYLMIIHFNS